MRPIATLYESLPQGASDLIYATGHTCSLLWARLANEHTFPWSLWFILPLPWNRWIKDPLESTQVAGWCCEFFAPRLIEQFTCWQCNCSTNHTGHATATLNKVRCFRFWHRAKSILPPGGATAKSVEVTKSGWHFASVSWEFLFKMARWLLCHHTLVSHYWCFSHYCNVILFSPTKHNLFPTDLAEYPCRGKYVPVTSATSATKQRIACESGGGGVIGIQLGGIDEDNSFHRYCNFSTFYLLFLYMMYRWLSILLLLLLPLAVPLHLFPWPFLLISSRGAGCLCYPLRLLPWPFLLHGHWLEIMTPLDQEKGTLYHLSQQYESARIGGGEVILCKASAGSTLYIAD